MEESSHSKVYDQQYVAVHHDVMMLTPIRLHMSIPCSTEVALRHFRNGLVHNNRDCSKFINHRFITLRLDMNR